MADKTYKIHLEDKAAFLNRLKKQGVYVCEDCIKTDKLDDPHYFSIKFSDPKDISIVDTILKQSPKINSLKEAIRRIVKEELLK